jgi:hypothetical protein
MEVLKSVIESLQPRRDKAKAKQQGILITIPYLHGILIVYHSFAGKRREINTASGLARLS